MSRSKGEQGGEAGEAAALLFGVCRREVGQLACEPCRTLSRGEIEALQRAGKITQPGTPRSGAIIPLPW